MMLGSGLSNQVGAAIGALAFPVLGPVGVVAVRQWVAGVVLLAIGRPRLRSFTWPQWWPVLALALVFATMNLSLYTAIDRIGLGLAVTLEFLGPLAVALAGSRRRAGPASAPLVAGAAVVVLARPQPTTDYLGIALGLLAAACWACLHPAQPGRSAAGCPEREGSAAAAGALRRCCTCRSASWPCSCTTRRPPRPSATRPPPGSSSSAVPFLADLLALRRVPARFFGVFMSVNPVLAALVGLRRPRPVPAVRSTGWPSRPSSPPTPSAS